MIAALAVFGCTSGATVPISENEFQDEANIETHLTDVPVEKRAVSSCKYIIMSFHLMLMLYLKLVPVHATIVD